MPNLWLRTAVASIVLSYLLIGAPQQRDTIRTGVDLEVVPVSVRDPDGKLVYDLKPEEFVVLEDGHRQAVRGDF